MADLADVVILFDICNETQMQIDSLAVQKIIIEQNNPPTSATSASGSGSRDWESISLEGGGMALGQNMSLPVSAWQT